MNSPPNVASVTVLCTPFTGIFVNFFLIITHKLQHSICANVYCGICNVSGTKTVIDHI